MSHYHQGDNNSKNNDKKDSSLKRDSNISQHEIACIILYNFGSNINDLFVKIETKTI